MPDPALSEALREAYALAPADQVIHHTIELWHPAFDVPVRVVRDHKAIDARIEAGADRDAGALVTFTAFAFDLTLPDQTTTALPRAILSIDNVGQEIVQQLDLAATSQDPIRVIYRAYLSDALEEGPQNDPPLVMTLTGVSATPLRIRGECGFPDLLNRRFPARDYTAEDFPGLVA